MRNVLHASLHNIEKAASFSRIQVSEYKTPLILSLIQPNRTKVFMPSTYALESAALFPI